jgi:hypothetical protein
MPKIPIIAEIYKILCLPWAINFPPTGAVIVIAAKLTDPISP